MTPLNDEAWDAWSPHELGQHLREAVLPWYVAGGWALDVWHGKQTREHEDLEFVVIRDHVNYFRDILHELDFFAVKDGKIEYLPPSSAVPGDVWQIWGGDMRQGCWRVDMMIEPGTPDTWIYKRDHKIQMRRSDAVRASEAGIPYLAPINALLFKARYCRMKDCIDLDLALSKLSTRDKIKLFIWLNELHPGHEWIKKLDSDSKN